MDVRKTAKAWSLLLVCGLVTSLLAVAQSTNSTDVRGIVADQTGAVLPGVKVTFTDLDKGVVRTITTDAAGLYDTGPITPDHYMFDFEAAGFNKFQRGPLTLTVGTITVNAVLKIGAAEQTISVNDDVALIDTDSGSQSGTERGDLMLNLPEYGADWQNFVLMLPGVALGYGATMTTSINGNLPFNSVLMDGANATLPMSQNTDVNVLETVAEVKVDTNAFSAMNGLGGAVMNQITKGGSNTWHGAAYEYLQNDALNAYDYLFPSEKGSKKAFQRYDNYGGSVSGPIRYRNILKNKMFFYFNYDHIYSNGGSSNGTVNLPTAAMISGDFTGLPTIYDPSTQTVDANGHVIRTAFANNIIPSNRISAVAKAFAAYYPNPKNTNVGADGQPSNNYSYNIPNLNPFDKFFGRLDYDLSSNNRLTISESNQNNSRTIGAVVCPIGCQNGSVAPNFSSVSDVWTISPSFINEARMGYAHELDFYVPVSLGQDYPTKLGWKFAKQNLPPAVSINNIMWLGPASNSVYKEFAFDPSDIVTYIHGHHILHFGGELLINRADSTAWGNINAGSLDFSGSYTSSYSAATSKTVGGVGFADFLLGYSDNWSAGFSPEYGGRLKIPQAFVQDDWKLRPNLTVNLGLRWQGMTGWSETHNNMRMYDPTIMNPATNTLGALWFGSTHTNGRTSLQAPVWDIYMPRVGAAYQINPKTVVHAGIGVYAFTWSMDTYGAGMGSALAYGGGMADSTKGVAPVVKLDDDGSINYQGSSGLSVNSAYKSPSTDPTLLNGQDVSYQPYHQEPGRSLQWNVAVQRQITSNISADVTYVGNHGYDLFFPSNLNQVPESQLSPTDSRPIKQYGNIWGQYANGWSNYNALQAQIRQRVSHGLEFNGNYTWSHMFDTSASSGWGPYAGGAPCQRCYGPQYNYTNSNFDHRHVFKASGLYTVPYGVARNLVKSSWMDQLIGGWQVGETFIGETGNPFTIYVGGANNSYSMGGNWFADRVGDPKLANRSINEWFNTAAFKTPALATFGNNPRNSVYGPSLILLNMSLGKNFRITEKMHFQMRIDTVNTLNHASFSNPDSTLGDTAFGQISGVSESGRHVQLYGRFSF
jgi:hypothetical protein